MPSDGMPAQAGSGGGGHTRRSLGLLKSTAPITGGGRITSSKTTNTRASQPKGGGTGKITPPAAVGNKATGPNVNGIKGRTVAGTKRTIK